MDGGGELDHGTDPCCIIAASTVLRKREGWFAICHTDDNNLQPKVLIGLTKHMAAYCT